MQLGVKFTPRLMLVRYMECGKFGWISESLSWDGLVDSWQEDFLKISCSNSLLWV